jgi:SpoVK/Ycf46/Vps4 family AAA+-type ATPase
MDIENDVIDTVGSKSHGFTPADLKRLCLEAYMSKQKNKEQAS